MTQLSYHMLLSTWADWLATSEPGDVCMYYRGESLFGIENKAAIIKQAWNDACSGKVYLVQRRVDKEVRQYLAVRASRAPIARLVATQPKPEVAKKLNPRRAPKPAEPVAA